MSDNHEREHERGTGGWQPVPQGGEYDDGATAFVQLPADLDALLGGDPLAAPGHGYVPPMIVPLTPAAATDPAATGTWSIPTPLPEPDRGEGQVRSVQWPDPAAVPAPPQPEPDPLGDPLRDRHATGQWTFQDDSALTGQWTIPVAQGELPDESGEFSTSSLIEQWGTTPPATLPGGAPAPWATQHPEPEPVPEAPAAAELPAELDAPVRDEHDAHTASWPVPGPGSTLGGAEPAPWSAAFTPDVDVREPEPHELMAHDPMAHEPELREPDVHVLPDAVEDVHGHAREDVHAEVREESATAADATVVDEPRPDPAPAPVPVAEPVHAPEPQVHQPVPQPVAAGGPLPEPEHVPDPLPEPVREPQPEPETEQDPAPDLPPAADLEHPRASYVLRVNGSDRPVTEAWVGESLLYVLRERLGLAGAKDGCSQGECGACNVQVDGRLVASCLVPAATAAGSEVRTVEGLAVDGEPSDVQRALAECGAVQCGFCIPGMAMTVHDLLEGNHAPTELETRQALCGNLCRCSGYRGVLDAVREVAAGRTAQAAAANEAAGPDESAGFPDEARIPHQAGPGAGGVQPPHTHDGGMA
ncbi:2Fe-2S iron-sulfur cluster-binding protein [Streptomyces sp. NPDC020719]|uniref:(2Fe-2S)-binding protein n=1 Tax=Streptomyces sp. NPDC020719 TaxID=3154896 RepID=UPI0033D27BB2